MSWSAIIVDVGCVCGFFIIIPFLILLDINLDYFWHLLALLRSYSVYDCYEGIIHGINVKEPFIFVVMYMIESDTEILG